MEWARILAFITGTVDQALRNEYLAAENRILRGQLKGRLRLSDAERAKLGEIGHRLGRKTLGDCCVADTQLGPGFITQQPSLPELRRDRVVLIIVQLTFSKPTLLQIMLSDASSWITRSALTASGRRSKVSYVASGSEDIDLK